MNSNFINIGNKAFVDAGKIKYIISADYGKVARLLSKYGIKRDDIRVVDTTANKETHSFLVMDDGTFGISSVNAKTLCDRANGVEKVVKKKNTITEEVAKEDDNAIKKTLFEDFDKNEHWVTLPDIDI